MRVAADRIGICPTAGPRGVSDSEDEPYSSPDTTLQYPGRPKTAPGGGAKAQAAAPGSATKVPIYT